MTTSFDIIVLDRINTLGEITDNIDALSRTLALSVIAPDDRRALQALQVAEDIARGMTEAEVEEAQARAELLLVDFNEVIA